MSESIVAGGGGVDRLWLRPVSPYVSDFTNMSVSVLKW